MRSEEVMGKRGRRIKEEEKGGEDGEMRRGEKQRADKRSSYERMRGE